MRVPVYFVSGIIIGALCGFMISASMFAYINTEGIFFHGMTYRNGKWQAQFEMKMKEGWSNEILHK